MTEFENLKRNYVLTVQFGLASNVGRQKAKHGNEILHQFCEGLIDNSNYPDATKEAMKHELELLKETLSKEIENYYNTGV